MGYVFNFHDAIAYEKWFNKKRNVHKASLETRLMLHMLKPLRNETLLDIGCGTGVSILPLLKEGIQVTGLDPSPYMLDIAYKNIKNRADLYRGFAEDLPFEDNSFNHASLFTTLEFVDDPQKAIEEACRIAKDRLFIGVLNSYALKGIQRRVKGIFNESLYNKARFFNIWELKQMIRKTLGDVPVTWRTVCHLPVGQGKLAGKIEDSSLIQRFPFGAFAGMVVTLVPRFKTRPLILKYQKKPSGETATGFAGSIRITESKKING